MASKICLHRKITWLFILLTSCIQKQDALIISDKYTEPVIQVRCILVPGYPAQIHSIFHTKSEATDSISYFLHSSNGEQQQVYHKVSVKEEYLDFTKITIKQGIDYKLTGTYRSNNFIQEIYIPLAFENVEIVQGLYSEAIPLSLNITGQNKNSKPTYLIVPLEKIDSNHPETSTDLYSLYLDDYATRGSDINRVGFMFGEKNNNYGNMPTKILGPCPTHVNLNYEGSHLDWIYGSNILKNDTMFSDFLYPQFGKLFFTQPSDRYNYRKLAYCDATSLQILKSMPEVIKRGTVPPFSNIRPYELNINSKYFQGYFLGFTMIDPPHVLVRDNSPKVGAIKILLKNGTAINQIKEGYIPFEISIKKYHTSLPDSFQRVFSVQDFYITDYAYKAINNRIREGFSIKTLQVYRRADDKKIIFEYRGGSFTSVSALRDFLVSGNELIFYENIKPSLYF